ncbi:MAG TPA: hypothetical protein VI911_04320 [Patescibacteria group bacterium]|nr:hypothetical protein [Patescibacteria group bacterium]
MPIYVAQCANNHQFRFSSSIAERDTERDCPTCGEPARYDLLARADGDADDADELREAPGGTVIRVRNGKRWRGLVARPFYCDACGKEHHLDIDFRAGGSNTGNPCPDCGATMRPLFTTLMDNDKYPYGTYDEGAGRTFTNRAERQAWMRANHVEEAGGKLDEIVDARMAKRREAEAADYAAYREDMDFYANHPEPEVRRTYHEAIAKAGDRAFTGEMAGRQVNVAAKPLVGV